MRVITYTLSPLSGPYYPARRAANLRRLGIGLLAVLLLCLLALLTGCTTYSGPYPYEPATRYGQPAQSYWR